MMTRIANWKRANPGIVANFRIIHSPPAAGLRTRALEPNLVNDRRLRKSVSALVPPWFHSQQAGSILPTLMHGRPAMPPERTDGLIALYSTSQRLKFDVRGYCLK